MVLRRYCVLCVLVEGVDHFLGSCAIVLLLVLLSITSFDISWPLAYGLANLADDDGAAANVLTLVKARCHLPGHMLLLLKLLLIR